MKKRIIVSSLFFLILLFAYSNCGLINSKNPAMILKGVETGNPMSDDGIAALPKQLLNSDYPLLPSAHHILAVGSAQRFHDCQAAIDAALPGDEIVIDAGFICSPVLLKNKGASRFYIVIRSAQLDQLPPQGTRVTKDQAPHMAIIETANYQPAVDTESFANHYYLSGLEVRLKPQSAVVNEGLVKMEFNITSADEIAHDIVMARCWIHGSPLQEEGIGVRLNGAAISIVDSIIDEIHCHDCSVTGGASPAIAGWKMGVGPFKIVNNELSASGAGVRFGGNGSLPGLIPSDIEFRKNHVYKNPQWQNSVTSLSGLSGTWPDGPLVDLRNVQRMLIDGNIIEYQFNDSALSLGPDALSNGTSNSGETWVRVQDVTVTNNIVRHVADGIGIVYQDPLVPQAVTQRVNVSNNVIYDIGRQWGASDAVIKLEHQAFGPVAFNHNTIIEQGTTQPDYLLVWPTLQYGFTYPYFTFTNNIVTNTGAGIEDGAGDAPSSILNTYFPQVVFQKNILAGQNPQSYVGYNTFNDFPASASAVGFSGDASAPINDYHVLQLLPSSPYFLESADGLPPGADINAIDEAMK